MVRPSFVLVLADDADAYKHEYARYMPTLHRRLVEGGTHLASHATEAALCGPARAALLTSRMPHSTGMVRDGDEGSLAAWMRARADTFGALFTSHGWHTAFLGKWVNDDLCTNGPPRDRSRHDGAPTWSRWAALCNVYAYYNASYYVQGS